MSKRKKQQRTALIITIVVCLLIVGTIVGIVGVKAARRAAYPLKLEAQVTSLASKYNLPPSLIYGVIHTESAFNPQAVSPVGAVGLMQIMPDTGAWLAGKLNLQNFTPQQLYEVEINLEMGGWYLRYLIGLFDGDMNAVLAGYNAGQGRVRGWLNDPRYVDEAGKLVTIPIRDAENYVRKVLNAQKNYRTIYGID